eukprot:2894910-Rhodomonas_salina.1
MPLSECHGGAWASERTRSCTVARSVLHGEILSRRRRLGDRSECARQIHSDLLEWSSPVFQPGCANHRNSDRDSIIADHGWAVSLSG